MNFCDFQVVKVKNIIPKSISKSNVSIIIPVTTPFYVKIDPFWRWPLHINGHRMKSNAIQNKRNWHFWPGLPLIPLIVVLSLDISKNQRKILVLLIENPVSVLRRYFTLTVIFQFGRRFLKIGFDKKLILIWKIMT